jgi:hypothetical protein
MKSINARSTETLTELCASPMGGAQSPLSQPRHLRAVNSRQSDMRERLIRRIEASVGRPLSFAPPIANR